MCMYLCTHWVRIVGSSVVEKNLKNMCGQTKLTLYKGTIGTTYEILWLHWIWWYYIQWQLRLPKCNIIQLNVYVDLTPEIYMNSTAHTSCTDIMLPSAYLGWGQGLSPHHQLEVEIHTEKGMDYPADHKVAGTLLGIYTCRMKCSRKPYSRPSWTCTYYASRLWHRTPIRVSCARQSNSLIT